MFRITLVVFFCICVNETFSQTVDYGSFRFMFYNCENLFDTKDDSLTSDEEFLPEGERGWSNARYYRKISSVGKVIVASGNPSPPSIVALCETESLQVFKDLVNSPLLIRFGYKFVAGSTHDRRGIRTGLLYRDSIIRVIKVRSLYPPELAAKKVESRDILECTVAAGADTFCIYVNHWPSRRGGILAGSDSRFSFSRYLKAVSDSVLMAFRPSVKVLITGDFNSEAGSEEIDFLIKGGRTGLKLLAAYSEAGVGGTYKYMGRWEDIDLIIVSESVLKDAEACSSRMTKNIFDKDFLFVKDIAYTGRKPHSTYSGYVYSGGYSDHLPVFTDIYYKKFRKRE
jgi:endonuclease/exonuclease/phosphatase family metal-dependent hydrolase